MKTSKEQLEHAKDWERRNPGRAQARKNKWFASAKGLAWIKKNQKHRNAKRKLWRAKKRREAKAANENAKRGGVALACLVSRLGELAKRTHNYCEDGWYSCPLAPDGCFNNNYPKDKCNCGASKHNTEVEEVLQAIRRVLAANDRMSDGGRET